MEMYFKVVKKEPKLGEIIHRNVDSKERWTFCKTVNIM